jgi:hypothetical protein
MQNQPDNPANTNASTDEILDAGLSTLSAEGFKVLAGLSGLALLEVRLASQSLTKYLTALFIRMLLLICIWVSLSVCVMWSIYIWTDSVFCGLIVMTLQQIIGFVIADSIRAMHKNRLTLPNTRHQIQQFGEKINDTIKDYLSAK